MDDALFELMRVGRTDDGRRQPFLQRLPMGGDSGNGVGGEGQRRRVAEAASMGAAGVGDAGYA